MTDFSASKTPFPERHHAVSNATPKIAISANDINEQTEVMSPSYVPQKPTMSPSPSRADLAKLTIAELRRRYPREATIHRGIVHRCRPGGGYKLDRRFHRFHDFLFHILKDLGPRPTGNWSVDRIDPHDPRYAPGLVRWADARTQQNNRTNTRHLQLPGSKKQTPLAEAARQHGIKANTVRTRLKRGWSVERALGLAKGASAPGDATPTLDHPTVADGNPWPRWAQPEKYHPPYQLWLREVPASIREYATRAVFCECLLLYRVELTERKLDIIWPEWRLDCDDDGFLASPAGKWVARLVDLQTKLAETRALIADTRRVAEFRALADRYRCWLIEPKAALGWISMAEAAEEQERRRARWNLRRASAASFADD